jgi:peptidoglycan hydrolase FlgJ
MINSIVADEAYKVSDYQKMLKVNDGSVKNERAAKDFETYFVSYMLKEMRKTVPEDGFMKKTQGEKIFEEMLDKRYAKQIVDKGGFGLSRIILEQMRQI